MQIEIVEKIDTGKLSLVLLCKENLEAVRAGVPNLPRDLELTAEDCNKEAQFRYWTADQRWLFYGMGHLEDVSPEAVRKLIHKAVGEANQTKASHLQIVLLGMTSHHDARLLAMALGEMPILSNYQFLVHKTQEVKKNTLENIYLLTDIADAKRLVKQAGIVAQAACLTRDLVNEPPNIITAETLAAQAQKHGKAAGIEVKVLHKKEIEELKMGGLLAVNRGSALPPTFTIMEYKPKNARNQKPVVLVGKGIVFDTGGLSLKPTPGSMDSMKCDMAGAATVIGTLVAIAQNELPVHVIGLLPATDNRPGYDAYTPNDVVTMMSGLKVEVLNTDAEGRMILGDALHYAKRYTPELVIDLATLTGAAVVALGSHATALMSTADREVTQRLAEAGERMYEKVAELPLWAEYDEQIKSDIADIKNIGGKGAGTITAGKFLQRFTDYPWMHLDIAGTAYLEGAIGWRPKNATGTGVRLLHEFLAHYA
ncbi:MAG: leucyl aminopeptidase [Bacteroidetes bacterium]|nr:leucyl aminopeptidase [Bacteroidota bacterium]